jgi:hypothetical protein
LPTGKVEKAAATAGFGGAEMTLGGTLGGVPVEKYHVVVTQRHVASWQWEIYRNGDRYLCGCRMVPINLRAQPERLEGLRFVSS